MILPVFLHAIKNPLLCGFSLFLILLFSCPCYASVYVVDDVSEDVGVMPIHICNQLAKNWEGIVLPFFGGFGEDANETGAFPNAKYYTIYDESEFICSEDDTFESIKFKLKLPYGTKYNSTYLMPISMRTDNFSEQYYIKITSPGTNENRYIIEVLDSEQNSILNSTVNKLGSSSPAYVEFENNVLKITHVNAVLGILSLWEIETGSTSTDINYSYCDKIELDICGYPYPCEVRIRTMDSIEAAKNYDSVPMAIYWLITLIIPDNNQSLYYFFRAVDTVWYGSLTIIAFCFSVPFLWVFFAGVCGLTICVLRGSFKSGFPAGIKTFVTVLLIPVKLVKFVLEMISRLITGIKP